MSDNKNMYAYLCGGNPKCFGAQGCGLCGRGPCYATTDIQCARNKVALLNNPAFREGRLMKVAMHTYVEVQPGGMKRGAE